MNIRTTVEALESVSISVPALTGWLRPAILLPIGLAAGLTASQLEAILAHELAHVRRHDYLVNLLQSLVETLFFYHPAVWYVSARIRAERENCCDDLVVRFGAEPRAYAESLLCVARRALAANGIASPALALAATEKTSALRRRVRRLLGATEPASREAWPAAVVVVGAIAGAALIYSCRAADPASGNGAPKPASTDMKPKDSAKLQAGMEEKMQWGQPVHGLQAAVVIRTPPDRPGAGKEPELYLAAQNVSDAPIRLNDTLAEEQPRMLYIKLDGKIQAGLGAKDPRLGDVVLQPQEVTFVRVYPAAANGANGRTIGAIIAEELLKDPHQTMVAEIQIEKAPAAAWTGKLVSGEVTGAAAAGRPQPKDKAAQALFNLWEDSARTNGDIPGGLIGRLEDKVKEFIHNNTGDRSGDPYAKKMEPLVRALGCHARLDAGPGRGPDGRHRRGNADSSGNDDGTNRGAHPQDGRSASAGPCRRRRGSSPPPAACAWRGSWSRARQYPVGTRLTSRILFHNSGKESAIFVAQSFNQAGGQRATRRARPSMFPASIG